MTKAVVPKPDALPKPKEAVPKPKASPSVQGYRMLAKLRTDRNKAVTTLQRVQSITEAASFIPRFDRHASALNSFYDSLNRLLGEDEPDEVA